MTGGFVDLYYFTEGTFDETVKEYHKLVGAPVLPPLWGLGWHQCRYGYMSDQELDDVVKGYTTEQIPLDVIWSDIEYMEKYQDFTIDQNSYANLPTLVT